MAGEPDESGDQPARDPRGGQASVRADRVRAGGAPTRGLRAGRAFREAGTGLAIVLAVRGAAGLLLLPVNSRSRFLPVSDPYRADWRDWAVLAVDLARVRAVIDRTAADVDELARAPEISRRPGYADNPLRPR